MPNRKRVSHKAGEAPKSLEQAFKKAREDHEAGNLVAARKQYRNLLKEHPHNAPLLFSKAVVLFQLDQIDEALPFLHRAIENDPENLEYINALGVFQRNMRLFNDAIQTFKKMLKTNPDCYEALHNLGLVYGDMHNYEKAIKYYKKALKIAPRNEDTLSNLAHALRDVNKPDEALGYYQQLADLHPKSHRHLLNLAVMLHGLGKFEDAVNYFERVVALDPTDKNTQTFCGPQRATLRLKKSQNLTLLACLTPTRTTLTCTLPPLNIKYLLCWQRVSPWWWHPKQSVASGMCSTLAVARGHVVVISTNIAKPLWALTFQKKCSNTLKNTAFTPS